MNAVYSRYRQSIERQHANIERHVDIQVEMPRPEARLQFADGGLELLVRYPVEIRNAPDIDEEMTRKVLELDRNRWGTESCRFGFAKNSLRRKGMSHARLTCALLPAGSTSPIESDIPIWRYSDRPFPCRH